MLTRGGFFYLGHSVTAIILGSIEPRQASPESVGPQESILFTVRVKANSRLPLLLPRLPVYTNGWALYFVFLDKLGCLHCIGHPVRFVNVGVDRRIGPDHRHAIIRTADSVLAHLRLDSVRVNRDSCEMLRVCSIANDGAVVPGIL